MTFDQGISSMFPSASQIIRLHEHGGPEVLRVEQEAVPPPGDGEVLVRHEAIGLNFIDTYFRSGLYPVALPTSLGNEAAGIVEAVGPKVDGFRVGDRVGYFTGPLGSYAAHRNISADRLVHLPDGITAQQAAAAMLKGCTAEYLIERCARVQPGDTVLVHAAAGGVGSILVQWLRSIGARVVAHSGDANKAALATALGAEHSLHCAVDDLAEQVLALTDGNGVRCVFDGVGAASWAASLRSLGRRGMIATFGNASGPVPPFTALDLMRAGSVFVTRPTLSDYCATMEEMQASANRLFEVITSGAVRVRVGRTFPLAQAADAHRALEQRATTGSTLIIPDF
jgi:NADPH2:quinone reductase